MHNADLFLSHAVLPAKISVIPKYFEKSQNRRFLFISHLLTIEGKNEILHR